MSKKAYFISDVHLTEDASPKGEALLFILKKAKEECELFVVLGDLFDWWMADGPAFQKKFPRIIAAFKGLVESGCRVIYFEGNHDIHLHRFWQKQLGVEVYTAPLEMTYQGKRLHLEHGDEINQEDRGYLFLRWFLRTPVLKFLSHVVPSKLLLKIGETSSQASRKRSSQIRNDVIALVRNYAQKTAREKQFDLMITGHTHGADDFSFKTDYGMARSINLGSWYGGAHYLVIDKDQIEFCSVD